MSTHPTPSDALLARAERGTARGPEAVLAGARAHGAATPVSDAPHAAGSGRPRALVAAAVVLVAASVGAAVLWREAGSDSSPAASADAFCSGLGAPAYPSATADADLLVYVEPGASGDDVAALAAKFRTDRDVARAIYIDEDAAYARFRDLFAQEPTLLEDVEPSELPTSFEVSLTPGSDHAVAAEAWRGVPGVFEVRDLRADEQARVLDLIQWVGTRPDPPSNGSSSTGFQASPDVWNAHVPAIRDAAPAKVASALDVLTAHVERREAPGKADDPAYARLVPAAAVVATAARETCSLEPLPIPAPTAHRTTATTSPTATTGG